MTGLGSQVTPSKPDGYLQVTRHEIEQTRQTINSAKISPL